MPTQHVSREVQDFAALQVRDIVQQAQRGTPAAKRKFMRDAELLCRSYTLMFQVFERFHFNPVWFRRDCGLPERKDPRRKRGEPA